MCTTSAPSSAKRPRRTGQAHAGAAGAAEIRDSPRRLQHAAPTFTRCSRAPAWRRGCPCFTVNVCFCIVGNRLKSRNTDRSWDFPRGPGVRAPCFQKWPGTGTPQAVRAVWPEKKEKGSKPTGEDKTQPAGESGRRSGRSRAHQAPPWSAEAPGPDF